MKLTSSRLISSYTFLWKLEIQPCPFFLRLAFSCLFAMNELPWGGDKDTYL